MKNEKRIIKKAAKEEVAEIYELFIEHYFPENEKKPLSLILRMIDENLYSVFYLEVEGKKVAAAFVMTYSFEGNAYLLDYLAVDEKERCKNYGGYLLESLKKLVEGKPILIETESIDTALNDSQSEERQRRNKFYKTNGAFLTGAITCIFGAVYTIWTLSEIEYDDEWVLDELRKIYHFMIPKNDVYEEMIEIPYFIEK